jgi:Holliday junction DNA helicase RuvA
MIRKIAGRLEGMEGLGALVVPSGSGLTYEVLVPAYLAERLLGQVGRSIELLTLEYLEGQGQGASFIPRLVGFGSAEERKFYELLITVKGMGNRKALKSLAIEPGAFARAIAERDARALQQLPEIGKRMAETVIAELVGKVEPFVTYDGARPSERRAVSAAKGPVADAIAALVALGESRADAERLVDRVSSTDPTLESAEAIIGAALAKR